MCFPHRTVRLTRRGFIKTAVGAAVLPAIGGCRRGEDGSEIAPRPAPTGRPAPSKRITLGFIGTGEHGISVNLKNFLRQPDAQILAFCDVDKSRMENARVMAAESYGSGASFYLTQDWREVVARDDIDAVVISTPDHWHALISQAALRAGKHVFCEKPFALTVAEGQVVCREAARYGKVYQVGTPFRARKSFARTCELVRNGYIGRLQTIVVKIFRGHGYDENDRHGDATPRPVPPGFYYDMWLGPAPHAPYTPDRCHFTFRYIRDYSGGNLSDYGAHFFDIAQWGNNSELSGPVSVEGQGVFPKDPLFNVATDWNLEYTYGNGVKLMCQSGGSLIRFEGTEGWIEADGGYFKASSATLERAVVNPEEIHLRTCLDGEQRDFLNCVANGREPYAPPDIEHRTATLAHIGNIALLTGRKLQWDPQAEVFVGDEDANRMLGRSMRAPWHL